MRELREKKSPARDAVTNGTVRTVPRIAAASMDSCYSRLASILTPKSNFEPVLLTDNHYYGGSQVGPEDPEAKTSELRRLRNVYRTGLRLPFEAGMYEYSPGGSHRKIVWEWKRPSTTDDMNTAEMRLIISLQSQVPVFHSRLMQAEAEARFRALPGVSSQIIGAMKLHEASLFSRRKCYKCRFSFSAPCPFARARESDCTCLSSESG